jgi:formamidase
MDPTAYVPGHNRWHPEIPPVGEVIAGGSIRMQCPSGDVLCGPVAVVGAEPGDLIAVEVTAIGREEDGDSGASARTRRIAHPGIIGCAPSHEMVAAARGSGDPSGALLGRVSPREHARIAATAVGVRDRLPEAACAFVRLTVRTQILLPVYVRGARLSVGDLHFAADPCDDGAAAGWIDLRLHMTKRGAERFRVHEPLIMNTPAFARMGFGEEPGREVVAIAD